MEEFYKKMLAKKAVNKLKWRDIGVVISKGESTIRTAFDRRSLSPLEMRELAIFYDLDMDFSHNDRKIEQAFKEEPADYITGAVEDIIAHHIYKKLEPHLELITNGIANLSIQLEDIANKMDAEEKS